MTFSLLFVLGFCGPILVLVAVDFVLWKLGKKTLRRRIRERMNLE